MAENGAKPRVRRKAATDVPEASIVATSPAPAGDRPALAASSLVRSRGEFRDAFEAVVGNIGRVIKGKDDVVRMMMVALLGDGHVLLEDMPGTGKTMMARALSQSINATVNRVQCTPDLLPSDITGSPIFDQNTGRFFFRE